MSKLLIAACVALTVSPAYADLVLVTRYDCGTWRNTSAFFSQVRSAELEASMQVHAWADLLECQRISAATMSWDIVSDIEIKMNHIMRHVVGDILTLYRNAGLLIIEAVVLAGEEAL